MVKDLNKVCSTCTYFNPRTGRCLLQLMLGNKLTVVYPSFSCGGWAKK